MRRIVVSEFISVDGAMEGPGPQDPYEHATLIEHDLVDEFRLMTSPWSPGRLVHRLITS